MVSKEILTSYSQKIKIDYVLDMIVKPEHHFPLPYQQIAQLLYDTFANNNELPVWGGVVKANAVAIPNVVESEASSVGASSTSGRSSPTAGVKPWVRAPKNHLIFGLNGPMHNIMVRKIQVSSYKIESDFQVKDFRIFGHNGLQIGTCWPRLIAAYRDGAHGKYFVLHFSSELIANST